MQRKINSQLENKGIGTKEQQALKLQHNENMILLPKFSCHILRHTLTTRLCESGINIKAIQSVLDHKDISTALDIYADVTRDIKRTEMEKFEDFMKKKKDAI